MPPATAHAGYGDPFIVTTVPYGGNAAAKWITTYFRRAFVSPSPADFTSLLLRVLRDVRAF